MIGLGALGHLGVQMAKAMVGPRPVATESSPAHPLQPQGYIVVGVDARPEPIDLVKSLALAPDLCINAATTSVDDALVQIAALDPQKPLRGLDGASQTCAVILPILMPLSQLALWSTTFPRRSNTR